MNWIIAGCHCCNVNYIFHLICGFTGSSTYLSDNDRYESAANTWASATNATSPARRLHGNFNVAGVIYNFAGEGGSGLISQNNSYTFDTWASKASISTARSDVAFGVIGDYGYCIKGSLAGSPITYSDLNEEYDDGGDSWTTKATLPTPTRRTQAACFSVDDGVFITGGQGTSTLLTDNDKYESAGDAWSAKTDCPTANIGFEGMTIGEKAYVVGGFATGTPNDNQEYDPAGDSWTAKTESNYDGNETGAAGFSEVGFRVAGVTNSGTQLQTNDQYTVASDTWDSVNSCPSPARYQANAVGI